LIFLFVLNIFFLFLFAKINFEIEKTNSLQEKFLFLIQFYKKIKLKVKNHFLVKLITYDFI